MVRTHSVVVKRESKSEAFDLLDDLHPNPHLWSRLREVTESSRLSKQGDTELCLCCWCLMEPVQCSYLKNTMIRLVVQTFVTTSLCFTFVSEIVVVSTVFVVK